MHKSEGQKGNWYLSKPDCQSEGANNVEARAVVVVTVVVVELLVRPWM